MQTDPFSYQILKDQNVFIAYNGKHVVMLSGKRAKQFIEKIMGADDAQAQLLMARATGNFRRGNERCAKQHVRNREA